MKKMTSKLALMLTAFSMIFLVSCEDEQGLQTGELDTDSISIESEIDGDFEDIDNYTLESMEINVYGSEAGNEGARVANRRHHLPDCAEITHDQEAKVITIDFGDGCEARGGKLLAGKIIITYTDRKFIPGSITIITFENFTVDGKLIEGVRTVENISGSLEDNPTFHITLVDGKVTFPDESFATREEDKTKMWVRAPNPLNDEFHILEGSVANGMNVEGVEYSVLVVETLIYKNFCEGDKLKIPVSGVKEVIKGDRLYVIDFGDGECDTLVTITSNGETKTIELRRRHSDGN